MKTCKIDGCDNKYYQKGFCCKHYTRNLKYGNPLTLKREQHRKTHTPTYRTWAEMITRCTNKKSSTYYKYGGRGISICDRWRNSYSFFLEDMGERPFPKAQIDRIDNDGNYESSNCRWVTCATNNQNRRSTLLNWDIVNSMRQLYKNKVRVQTIADIYNIKKRTVWSVVTYENWRE